MDHYLIIYHNENIIFKRLLVFFEALYAFICSLVKHLKKPLTTTFISLNTASNIAFKKKYLNLTNLAKIF